MPSQAVENATHGAVSYKRHYATGLSVKVLYAPPRLVGRPSNPSSSLRIVLDRSQAGGGQRRESSMMEPEP